ncbi:MAG: tetratricopeptide repeat protein [Nibricoccus sp.]
MNQTPQTQSSKLAWLSALLLVLAVVFAYQPAWDAGFIWDDDHYVTQNELLSAPDGLKRIWFSTDSPSQYFPLVYTTFRLEHALWGLHAPAFHWVNILLHAVNALLVWRLLRQLGVPGAWLGAAIFALHPVQAESVAWITELKNVQSLFFFLLALLAWVKFTGEKPSWRWYAVAIVCHALALFSKTTACTFPAAQLLVLWLLRKPIDLKRWAQVAPFVAMGIVMGVVSIWWERNHQGTVGDTYTIGWMERFLVAGRAVWFYLGKLLWPANLTFNYPLWDIRAGDPFAYLWLLAGCAAAVAIYFARRFAGRSVEVAAVFFVATLVPMIGFFMMYTFRYTFVADHYQYVAMLGPAALFAAGLHRALDAVGGRRRAVLPLVCAALVLALGTLTWRQARMYEDLETLWRVTVERNPDSHMGHNNLGAIYLGRGQIDDAIRHFERALEILPSHGNAHGNLGHALMEKGRFDAALASFQKSVEVEPTNAKAHSDLGYALLQAGRLDDAIAHCEKAVAIEPKAAEAQNMLSVVYLQAGRLDDAIAHAREALRLQAGFAEAHHNLALGLSRHGQLEPATAHFQSALKIAPDFTDAHLNFGYTLLAVGRADEAIGHFRRAAELQPQSARILASLGGALCQTGRADEGLAILRQVLEREPDFVDAHYMLAVALGQSGQWEEALRSFRKITGLQPGNPEAHNNLGWALLQAGRVDDAIRAFETVLKLQPDFAMGHSNLATALLRKGEAKAAIARYQSFLEQQPDHPFALADLAWVLATWPEDAVRNGARALELAQRANRLSGGEDPNVLRALAAAYAEGGRFAEAISTARRGAELADAQSNAPLGEALRAQLKAYEAGSPFREPARPPARAN